MLLQCVNSCFVTCESMGSFNAFGNKIDGQILGQQRVVASQECFEAFVINAMGAIHIDISLMFKIKLFFK